MCLFRFLFLGELGKVYTPIPGQNKKNPCSG
jgi:hypothetical protein